MIQVKDVNKSFQNNRVLKNLSLDVNKGETFVIIGPSGSGKSTFLRTINFLEIPDAGELSIDGKQINFQSNHKYKKTNKHLCDFRQKTGMVFQEFNLFEHMTVINNVIEGLITVKKMDKKEALEKGWEYLERVGLSDKAKNYPNELSGGQKQRVAIARALAMQPKAILFDEPTSALDPELVGEVLQVIKKLSDEGMTIIIVTHEMNFAKDVGDRIAFMDNGEFINIGTPHEIFDNPESNRLKQFLSQLNEH